VVWDLKKLKKEENNMKIFRRFTLFVTLLLSAVIYAQSYAQSAARVEVVVTGLSNDQGVVRIALYNSEEAYQTSGYEKTGAFKTGEARIHQLQARFVFENVPYGIYAIKLYHSKDLKPFETNLFGIPKQGYGFSNNPEARFGMPGWQKVAFEVKEPHVVQNIQMLRDR
jgi:uncharacterized protein (DUF2141 family)